MVFAVIKLTAQSPHGQEFKIECSQCHTADNWKVNRAAITFEHDSTSFVLNGQHQTVDCRACHTSLVFSDASPSCISCHQDIHSQSLGNECARCHTSNSWIIENISRLHELASFPLLGNHASADCVDCHLGAVPHKFERVGSACINCHESDYLNTAKLDHKKAGFSNECSQCHDIRALNWSASFNHEFFPLTKGHAVEACSKCHTSGYTGTSTKCVDCHTTDFNAATNPNHKTLNLSTDCASCHTTEADWTPASFPVHNQIYKLEGAHAGIANQCAECHHGLYDGGTPKTCFGCHLTDYNETTNPNHKISYYPTSCETCHNQTSWGSATFDHGKTKFPLTGVHHEVNCIECHAQGYTGISTKCVDCHISEFNAATSPNHKTLNLSTDCAGCHTTSESDWTPASFPDHNQIYKLEGAHAGIANQCAECHHGIYDGSTPKTCFGCHATNY
ncbi:MAG: hypothetical protein SH818_01985, partial [Saprospiraceae bacterium]|nr:hypothetical protein [Saprospiraceae bacterium]